MKWEEKQIHKEQNNTATVLLSLSSSLVLCIERKKKEWVKASLKLFSLFLSITFDIVTKALVKLRVAIMAMKQAKLKTQVTERFPH